jgi:hypothetical protein
MSTIPLDLERRLEQRCAARYLRPSEPAATPRHPPEKQDQQLAAAPGSRERPVKSKRKTRRIDPAGIRSAPAR